MTPLAALAAPFPGLRPFQPSEAQIFFGRDEQIGALLERLARHRFLAVVGASGTGKSSLVRAGLLPAIKGGYLGPTGTSWRIAITHPGDNPMGELAGALREALVPSEADTGGILPVLSRSSRGLEELCRRHLASNERILLLLDQFEEIFRFRSVAGEQGRVESAALVRMLLDSTGNTDVIAAGVDDRVYVVLTMRSEYIGKCALFRGLPEP